LEGDETRGHWNFKKKVHREGAFGAPCGERNGQKPKKLLSGGGAVTKRW